LRRGQYLSDPRNYKPWQIDREELEIMANPRLSPTTWGTEIEQGWERLPDCFYDYMNLKRQPKWRYEGNAREWDYGPYSYHTALLKSFYRDLENAIEYECPQTFIGDLFWEWGKGGCHWHFSLREDVIREWHPGMTIDQAWSIAWNTCVEVMYLMAPFFMVSTRIRKNAEDMAYPETRRLSSASVFTWLDGGYSRNYTAITFNPPDYEYDKPWTIELRMAESFPLIAAAGQRILSYLIRMCIKRGFSPKMLYRERLKTLAFDIIKYRKNVYKALADTGEIAFERPMPYPFTRQMFENGIHFLKHLCYSFLVYLSPAERYGTWFARVLWFFYHLGNPRKEGKNLWWCYLLEDFQWETVPEMPTDGSLPPKV